MDNFVGAMGIAQVSHWWIYQTANRRSFEQSVTASPNLLGLGLIMLAVNLDA
ncbi:MAG: hypothetical protein Q7U33_11790 [Methylotenera sp.]|uniref:hypothetical protein n=1 Tax=Methylotenera sp. TaxID=2051956 RepID=UPI00271D8BCE|nr:hypothetical protein [Methylotenera sp.]MDO9152050.1 hypothetical protein [Methylotenera sp.]